MQKSLIYLQKDSDWKGEGRKRRLLHRLRLHSSDI